VFLAGADNAVAQRVADRISDVVQTKGENKIAVSRAVAELGNPESFEDTIARAAERLRSTTQKGRPRIA
jgi:hypothetical protein